jgi:pyruvate,orthophosphate dikinase
MNLNETAHGSGADGNGEDSKAGSSGGVIAKSKSGGKSKRASAAVVPSFPAADLAGPIFADDPFQTLDPVGVGALVRTACEKGRASNPRIKLGICGEHGGDPKSIQLCDEIGLDYVSCSPFRVPVARLAAAQSAIAAESAGASNARGRKGRAGQGRSRQGAAGRSASGINRSGSRGGAKKKAARSSSGSRTKKRPTRRAKRATGGLAALAKTRTQNQRRARAKSAKRSATSGSTRKAGRGGKKSGRRALELVTV